MPASQPQEPGKAGKIGSAPLAAHIARPAYKLGSGSAVQIMQEVVANCTRRLAGTDVRTLLQSEQFWRRAWIASFVLAALVVLGAWHWWAAVVQAWPAAARLHQPG